MMKIYFQSIDFQVIYRAQVPCYKIKKPVCEKMNEKEKLGCKEILNTLQTDDLFSLTDTVTKKLVNVSSRSGKQK